MNVTLSILAAAWTVFQIDPFYTKPHSRDAVPEDGRETAELIAAAAIGEIEAVSFMFRPEKALPRLDLVPGDLKGPDGATIPASAVDVRTVKVWWQDRERWTSYYNWEKFAKKNALLPDILLHDDSLIRVDEKGTNNYLRIDYPEGTRYVCVSENTKGDFNDDLEPVRDAKSFVPFDVEAGRYRQYWLTLRVPADAKPGAYRGRIAFVSDGRDVGGLDLALEVYPFTLPTPRTRRDPAKEFFVWMMNHDTIDCHYRQGKDLSAAVRKVYGIYRNMAEHNCHPGGAGEIKADSPDDLGLRGLQLLQKAGLGLKPLFAGGGSDWGWVGFVQEQAEKGVKVTPETHPKEFAEAMRRFAASLDRTAALYRKYAGHDDLIFSASDEGSTALNRLQFPFWDVLHRRGYRVFATAGDPAGAGHEIDMNDILSTISAKEAAKWHAVGGTAYSYAAQFLGAIQPDHYRRDKGLRFWSVNYDGINEYVWYEGVRWNDFIENTDNYGTFGIVFPVQDGVLDTCAWEAYREGIDDIRYLSLLNLRATAAMKSSDATLARKGRAELAWLLSVDSESDTDLNALRREVAKRIQTLPACAEEAAKPFSAPPIKLGPLPDAPKDLADVPENLAEDAYDKAVAEAVAKRLERRDRRGALKLLEKAAEHAPVTAAHRAKMQLEQAAVLLTVCNYAEVVAAADVDRAASLLERARAVAGFAARKREVFRKVLSAYESAGSYDKVLDLTAGPVADRTTSTEELQALRAVRVRAAGGKNDYALLVREFNAYEKLGKGPQRKDLLLFVGEAAARQNDAKVASRAFTELYAYFDPKDDGQKYERGRAERAMNLWTGKLRKDQKFDGTVEEETISLDED